VGSWSRFLSAILVIVPAPVPAPLAADYAERPYWWDGMQPRRARVGPLPAEVDVAVVGGGLTGLSAAIELVRAGRTVAVLERDLVGEGASSRNGGMVHPGTKLELSHLLALDGGRELWDDTVAGFEALGAWVGELGIDCGWRRTGHVELAHHPRLAAALASSAAAFESVGEDVELLGAARVRDEVGSDRFTAGLVVHRSAALDPGALTAGIVAVAEAAGAELCDRTEVLDMSRDAGTHVVRTSRGPVRAGAVVVATDGTTPGGPAPWLGRRVLGVGSFVVATEPLDPDLVATVSPRGRMLFDTRNFLHYWRPSPDGTRVLFGGRTSFAPTTLAQARDRLYAAMVGIHPQLAAVRLARAWGGEVGLTTDRMPHVGRHDDTGVVYALGYCGTGVALATHFGRCVGRWLAGGGALPAFAGRRFPVVPAPARVPGLLPVAGWWYLARDALGR
jgi:glycine/D-amino acid oxidase-like deaminating enzyme